MRSNNRRILAVLMTAALAVGALGALPAEAKKKKKKTATCAPFAGAGDAAGAPTTALTAAATEEKPVEVKIEAPPGVPEVAVEHVYHNVQINTAALSGLFVRYEFQSWEDYDLYLLDAAGEEAARSAGFNPTPFGPFDGTGNGGHSEQGAEQIDGFPIANCQGFSVDMATYMGEGGELTLKLWLGDSAA